jgi:hypothetical protein
MQNNGIQSTVGLSTLQQIPLVNSTQIVTQSTPVINSQVTQTNPVTSSSPILTDPNVSVSYAPIVSAIKPPQVQGQIPVVKVVPIYD